MAPGPVEELGWVTGEQSPNKTGSRFGMLTTDLGICWDDAAIARSADGTARHS